MSNRSWTRIILTSAVVGLIVWDIYAYSNGGGAMTISKVIYDVATEHPMLPFFLGVLAGHFFWAQKIKVKDE